jgi:hypothetical protein
MRGPPKRADRSRDVSVKRVSVGLKVIVFAAVVAVAFMGALGVWAHQDRRPPCTGAISAQTAAQHGSRIVTSPPVTERIPKGCKP